MKGSDKVIIALGFFALVGFMSYLYFLKSSPVGTASQYVTFADLKRIQEEQYVPVPERWRVRNGTGR